MLKLAYSTLICDGWNAEKIIDYCKRYGYSGVEIREGQAGLAEDMLQTEKRKNISDMFSGNGINITNLGTSICFKGYSRKQIELLENSMKIAKDLNARGMRIFLGNFCQRKDDLKEALDYEGIVQCLKEACNLAKQYQLSIWIETHNEYATGKILRSLLDDIGEENCGVIWDIIHPLEDGEPLEETIQYLGKQCVHVHVKDGMPFDDIMAHDWKYTRLGKGQVPVENVVQLLQNEDYQGYYSLEWEAKWRPELQFSGTEAEIILPEYSEFMNNLNIKYK